MIKDLLKSDAYMLHHRVEICGYHLDRKQLTKTLVENMFHYEGVGLAANQIGIWERAFCMIIDFETQETITCFNPKIIKTYGDPVWCEEGCLSYPNESINVKRQEGIIAKYEDEDKKVHELKLDGFLARVFQHEYDHLEGIDFTQR
jgi:peptide deformylase